MKETETFAFIQSCSAIISNTSVESRIPRDRSETKADIATVIHAVYDIGGRVAALNKGV